MLSKRFAISLVWIGTLLVIVCFAAVGVGLWLSRSQWYPQTSEKVTNFFQQFQGKSVADAEKEQEEHPAHEGEEGMIELSKQAQKNIQLQTTRIELQNYEQKVAIPARIVERPGHSQVHVPTPMTGIVTKIFPIQGQAVRPGEKLFMVRLTHEELVDAQSQFLTTRESLDVEEKEIARLKSLTKGLIAGKTILEREYAKKKLEGQLHAQRQRLMLHGLSSEQVDYIEQERKLQQLLTVVAPEKESSSSEGDVLFHLQTLNVHEGQQVSAGESMCVLANHSELLIEGIAFEEDFATLNKAVVDKLHVQGELETIESHVEMTEQLTIENVADHVDKNSRALHFYIRLPNEIVRRSSSEDSICLSAGNTNLVKGWMY